MKNVKLTYFKESGKYYSDDEFVSNEEFSFDIYAEVRNWNKTHRGETLPGLSCFSWEGYILVVPEDCAPALIDKSSCPRNLENV